MKSIGPYVVLREVELEREADRPKESVVAGGLVPAPTPRRRSSHTFWAADRLTGMPVLLHPLRAIAPVPQLPAHPRLLPFTDMVAEMSHAYLVTELPPQTRRASDPMRAARAALELLDFLHRQDLVHGSLNAAQLWEVDGQVRVSGAGLPRLGRVTKPADDLRDLATALEDLGGLPPLLAMLRGAGDLLSAREMLDLLNVGLSFEQLNEALELMPALSMRGEEGSESLGEENAQALADLFGQDSAIVLGGALSDDVFGEGEVAESPPASVNVVHQAASGTPDLTASHAAVSGASDPAPIPEPARTPEFAPTVGAVNTEPPVPVSEVGEWQRLPEAEKSPPSAKPAAVPPALTPAGRPRLSRRAARQASERLKADHRRRLDLSILRRERTAAVLEKIQSGQTPTGNTTIDPDTLVIAPLSDDTPQERRRLEHQVWEEQLALDRELAAARRAREAQAAAPAAPLLPSKLKVPAEIGEIQRRPKAPLLPQQVTRTLPPIRMNWGRGGERQVLRALSPREELLRWVLPALGALLVSFGVATLVRWQRPAPAPCCAVTFQLRGPDQTATLTLLNAPSSTGWQLGRKLGSAPGTVVFPAAGTYRIKLNADGYAPARVNVTVPTREPIIVELAP